MSFILGKKLEMTQVFNDKGDAVPVTLVEVGPCFVLQNKTKESKDGYDAVQIGFEKKEKKIKKSEKGKEYKHLKEFRILKPETCNLKQGDEISVGVFNEGDSVKISGISKGKGFQGGVKRYGFGGHPKTHGTKHEVRTIGSVGATDPARVFPGKRMPGHMGDERISVRNLKIIKIDLENNLIAIKGAIPGRRGSLLEITSMPAKKKK
ncbi:MAG: 50S ribosomal protein L3 [Candidatus Pacebacteria bacterium]|nr:50S ribosomal protein L3 [Candidatus Paceibacterota bacterium]